MGQGRFGVKRAAGTITACCALALASSGAAASTESDGARDRFDSVVVDAGHGGQDHGARGEAGLIEKELVLDVAQRLATRLRAHGVHVVETRTGDVFVPLESRTSLANDAHADLFISVHANSSRSAKPRGIETYFVSLAATDDFSSELAQRENDAFGERDAASSQLDPLSAILGDMTANEYVRESSSFARLAHEELAGIDKRPSRGVRQAPFVVLMGVAMPASLIEIGFISNAAEERALSTAARRDAIADALTRAALRFGADYDKRRGSSAEAAVDSFRGGVLRVGDREFRSE